MRTRAKGTSRAAVFAAGFVALGVTAIPSNAFADVTDGAGGILSGNQVNAPVSAPVDVSGNGASVLGATYATSHGGTKVRKRDGAGQQTSGGHGVASGNQVNAPVSVPVNVCGNGAGVLGHADAGCDGGAKVKGGGKSGQVTGGTGGVLAGNQVNAPISIPVEICGNAAAIVGAAAANCQGQTLVKGSHGSGAGTSGEHGAGSGNQANAPVTAPADVCGNAAAVVGLVSALCQDEQGHGGYDPYYRSTGAPLPGTGGIPEVGGLNVADGLFTVTGLPEAKALPGAGGAPQEDARSKADGLPVDGGLPELSGSPVTNALTQVDGAHVTDGLPGVGGLTETAGLPEAGGVPGSGARSKDGLPGVDGLLGSVLNPEILRGATPPGELPVGPVRGVDGLSSLAGGGAPAAVSLLGTRNPSAGAPGQRTIPGVPGGTVLPAAPVVPSAPDAATGLPETGALSTPATGVVGPVRPVGAEETVGPRPRAGTTWTVGAAAMLAFAAGLLGLARGIGFRHG